MSHNAVRVFVFPISRSPGGLGLRPWHFSAVHLVWILGGVCAGWAVWGCPGGGGSWAPGGPGVGAVLWDTL